jgi:23S rRNA (uridine2552-2'-O)-methyltransferase
MGSTGRTLVTSARWRARQERDVFVKARDALDLRSRAAFKLIEIDDKHRLLHPTRAVIDLGACPGGWTQVCASRVLKSGATGLVVSCDLKDLDPLPGVRHFVGDFNSPALQALLRAAGSSGRFDVVLSDMAPSTSGHRALDHDRSVALCAAALAFARQVLRRGGAFVSKLFDGAASKDFIADVGRSFDRVVVEKPSASRAESAEKFIVAKGFQPPPLSQARELQHRRMAATERPGAEGEEGGGEGEVEGGG